MKSNQRNYYRVLHVQPDAPTAIIKASYRTLMQTLKAHPDLGGEHWDAGVINEAYRVLSDPARRQRYDEALFRRTDLLALSRQRSVQRHRRQRRTGEDWRPFQPPVFN